MRVLVAVPLSVYSGYGNDGIGLIMALLRKGIDVRVRPTHVDPPLPKEIAHLLTQELEPPFDLYLNHVDPLQLKQTDHNAEHATMSVGWTMWEMCVDEATEIFTKRGWLRWDEVEVGDESLAIDPDTGLSSWQAITNIYVGPYMFNRELVEIDTWGVSALTTPNHRWLIRNNGGNLRWKTTETLVTGNHVPRSAPRSDLPVDAKFSDDFVALVAWTYTEGWLERGKSIRIGQSSKYPENVTRIREILHRLYGPAVVRNNPQGGRTWSERSRSDGVSVFNLSRQVSQDVLDVCPGKVPSWDFLSHLTQLQLDVFIQHSLWGDGDYEGTTFYQSLSSVGGRARMDAFVAACLMAGYSVTPVLDRVSQSGPSGAAIRQAQGIAGSVRVQRGKGRWSQVLSSASETLETQMYSGRVWCPTLRHGNWLARRNGKVYFTGNTSLSNAEPEHVEAIAENTKYLDVVFGYDPVSVQALSTVLPVAKLDMLQGGFTPDMWLPPVERDWTGDRFAFCMVGMLHDRKDPFTAITAFQELKREKGEAFEGAELHLKTSIPGLHPKLEEWCPKLRIHYASWPQEVLKKFYESQHVLLAPSHGEGKNVPALEMMTTGGAVIATNFGGHAQWLNSDYAYPLDFQLGEVNNIPNCLWANASKDHLKELMWHVYTHRDEVREKAHRAQTAIPEMCSWDAVVDRLMVTLGKRGDKGEKVYAAYRSLTGGRG
jgi:glycosyltransferase involved in cell wall biosynthesis